MLTDRGRWMLAFGGGTYLVAWGFGSEALYPIALGLVLAVAAAALWVRFFHRPMRLHRLLTRTEHLAGDDVPVRLELEVDGNIPAGSLVVRERIARLGERETALDRRSGKLVGMYTLPNVPRGRYPVEGAHVVLEDPFSLERIEVPLPTSESILVYPRLVELDSLFSESGSRALEGRRLLLRRTTGFDLHSVREYEQGESCGASTGRRPPSAQLMVKELEDAPRDEVAVVLDADASIVTGRPPDSTFELQVRAAGSILKAHASRGRRAALVINSIGRPHQRVYSFDGDWRRAFELLAAVEPDGPTPVTALLADEAGVAQRALELTVVTAVLTPRLADRLLQRALARHASTLVYVDPVSFAPGATRERDAGVAAQIVRLERGGVPVAVLHRDDDLVGKLGAQRIGAAVG